jgi:hypothetical protein
MNFPGTSNSLQMSGGGLLAIHPGWQPNPSLNLLVRSLTAVVVVVGWQADARKEISSPLICPICTEGAKGYAAEIR